MEQETEKQYNNTKGYDWLKEYHWQKGQSGNPNGRPKTRTLKEYAREFLANMSEEGRIEYFSKIKPEEVWKMAEGNPESKDTVTLVTPNIQIAEDIANKYAITPSPKTDSKE